MKTSDTRLTGWKLLAERLYRLTHGGQIRTLVLSQDQIRARNWADCTTCEGPLARLTKTVR